VASSTPGTWDVVIGVCQSQINALLADLPKEMPRIYTTAFGYQSDTIEAVEVTCLQPPTVTLEASPEYLALARQHALELGVTGDVEAAAVEFTQATGTFSCANVEYILLGPTERLVIPGSFRCAMALVINNNVLSMTFSDCTVTMASNPTGDPAFDTEVAGNVLEWLYNDITLPFQIPLTLPGGTFSAFATAEDSNGADPVVLAYTGFAPVVLPTGAGQWPQQAVFIAVDAAVINALANANIPEVEGDGGISTPNFSWDFHATLTCSAQLNQSSGNLVDISLGVSGGASITYHAPNGIPNPTIGASISGSCSAQASLTVISSTEGQTLRLEITQLGGFDLGLDLGSCPSLIAGIVNDCVGPLINDIVSHATAQVPGTSCDLFTIPPITFSSINMEPLTLTLDNFTPKIVTAPAGVQVLGLYGQVSIAKG